MKRVAALVLAGFAAGCAVSMNVRTEQSPGFDLLHYRKYCWASAVPRVAPEPGLNVEAFDWRVRSAVDHELVRRGLEKTDEMSAELLVDYRLVYEQETAETLRDLYNYRRSGGPKGVQDAYTFGYEQGALVVELTDASTARRVWRGSATAVVDTQKPERQHIREAVQLMFRKLM